MTLFRRFQPANARRTARRVAVILPVPENASNDAKPAQKRWSRRRLAVALTSSIVMTLGCNGDSPALILTPVDAPTIAVRIISGDRQLGVAGDTLAPIVALVTDLAGVPKS